MPALTSFTVPALYLLGSLVVGGLGRRRKWGFWGYFWASLVMSPVLGLLFVLAGDKPPRRKPAAAPPPPPPPPPQPHAADGIGSGGDGTQPDTATRDRPAR